MKKIGFLLALPLLPNALAATQVVFEYGSIYDLAVCPQLGADRKKIMLEARDFTRRFQPIWDKNGPVLLRKAFELLGREMPRKELTAYTVACRSASMSSPFIVNIRRYLKNTHKHPLAAPLLVQLAFHEFTHKYLVATFDYGRSAILKNLPKDSPLFRNHIHLMALEARVYAATGRKDLMDRANDMYNAIGGEYKRSWEYATDPKDQAALMAELKALRGTNEKYWFFGDL